MFVDVLGQEDGIDIGQGLHPAAACLIVDNAYGAVVHQVEAVYASSDGQRDGESGNGAQRALYIVLKAKNGERRQTAVDGDELAKIVDDDFAVDELQSACGDIGHLLMKCLVDSAFDFHLRLQQMVEQFAVNLSGQPVVDDVGSLVEDITEDAIVQLLFVVGQVGLPEISDIAIIELQGTTHILVDSRGGEQHPRLLIAVGKHLHHPVALLDGLWLPAGGSLTGQERVLCDGLTALDQHLQHKAAHLAPLSVFGGVVIENGDIRSSLQQAVKIIGIDADLVFDGSEFVGVTDAVGDEGTVVDTSWHIALVAGQQQHMVEVEVAGLEYPHHLDPFCRFAMKGDAGLLHQLADQALHGDIVDGEVATFPEVV